MGDNFLKQQIRNFEKSTDVAVDSIREGEAHSSLRNLQDLLQGQAARRRVLRGGGNAPRRRYQGTGCGGHARAGPPPRRGHPRPRCGVAQGNHAGPWVDPQGEGRGASLEVVRRGRTWSKFLPGVTIELVMAVCERSFVPYGEVSRGEVLDMPLLRRLRRDRAQEVALQGGLLRPQLLP